MEEIMLVPKLGYEVIQVRNGKIIKRIQSPCHSYTRWFIRKLCNATLYEYIMDNRLKYKTEDYDSVGTLLTDKEAKEIQVSKIAVGASNRAFSLDDYKLYDKRMEVLRSQTDLWTEISPPTESGNTCYWEVQAKFNITDEWDIWETGLFAFMLMEDGYYRYFLLARDVLPSPFHVVPGDIVFVRYKCTVG
jgi:hypothetical protein